MARDSLGFQNNDNDDKEIPAGGLGTQIAALFAKNGLTSDIPELRGFEIIPPEF
jgi:hypothetical protein